MTRSSRCIVALGAALTFMIGCVDIDPVQPPRSNPTPPAAEPQQPVATEKDYWVIQLLRVGDTTPTTLTAGADPVRRAGHLEVVRVVAIRTAHALRVHLALEKGSVLVDLVPDLPVGVVQALVEERRAMRLQERLAVGVLRGDDRAPRVTAGAGLDLGL